MGYESTAVRVGIVGGGASGTLVAARLLRDATGPVHVVVFEPREALGEGIAYSTTDPLHVLNVPASGMSALPEDPDHFRRWVGCQPTDFVPRVRYAEYLRFVLTEARAQAPWGSDLVHVVDTVADVIPGHTPTVVTDAGQRMSFDRVVLATGHQAAAVPAPLSSAGRHLVADPWAKGALENLPEGARVLIVGTGLTFVDVSMSILGRVKAARITAVSRHGLLPVAHEDPWRPRHDAPDWDLASVTIKDVVDYISSFGDDWRRGLDSLRPITPALWRALGTSQQEVFMRHLARYWDVHRHRMAPAIAALFHRLSAAGRISIESGSIESVQPLRAGVRVTLSNGQTLDVDRIVLCTGPTGDVTSSELGRSLVLRGSARPGPHGIGYAVDPQSGALLDSQGIADQSIVTIGPLRRGELWESTAMPEIRCQAAEIAAQILQLQTAAA